MSPPPAAFDTQSNKRKKGRSSSFSEFMYRLRPSNREERGGTFRSSDIPVSPASAETRSEHEGNDKKHPLGGSLGRRMFSLNSKHISQASEGPQSPRKEETMKRTQHVYAEKDQRHSRQLLRASGDFLGVQGANPRTGFWDPSASSSTPSQMSEETKHRLEQERRNVAEHKIKYEEAQARLKRENDEREAAREERRAEKAEHKKEEQVLRQRRHGRWKMGDNGWKSVAEPELSPIVQSAVASPVRETALSGDDRLFPMPTSTDPNPYIDSRKIEPKDYFGNRAVSSPLVNKQISQRTSSIMRKPIGSRPTTHHRNRHVSSSGTIIQAAPGSDKPPPGSWPQDQISLSPNINGKASIESEAPATQLPNAFLDQGLPEVRDTTVTSYQSISTSQAQIHHPSGQNPSSKGQIMSIEDFPPVVLKDPAMAGKPLSSRVNRGVLGPEPRQITRNSPLKGPELMTPPKSILMRGPKQKQSSPQNQPSFNIPITTTTGYDLHHHPFDQLDGMSELINETQANRALGRKSNIIPVRTSSFMKTNSHLKEKPNNPSQASQDTATSSEHLLGQTKRRTAELCRKESPVKEAGVKTIPTSTSTSPHRKENLRAAQNAAVTAVQRLDLPKDQKAGQLINRPRPKVDPRGQEGTENHFGTNNSYQVKGENYTYERRLIVGDGVVGTKYGLEDKLVVWHPSPAKSEKVVRNLGSLGKSNNTKPAAKGPAKKREHQISIGRVLQAAWWFVEPVFDPESALRSRWEGNSVTWQDISVLVTAMLFMACLALMLVVCGRTMGLCLRILRLMASF